MRFDRRAPALSSSLSLPLLLALAAGAAAQDDTADDEVRTADDAAGAPTPDRRIDETVCDGYGEGYSTIPGTDTCLRIGGYVRYDGGFGDTAGLDTDDPSDGGADTWNQNVRFALNTYTSAETDLGTLSSFVEARFNYGNDFDPDDPLFDGPAAQTASSTITLNFAWIELGGVRLGKGETLFDTFTGYGGAVIADTLVGGYGPFDTNFVSYTYDEEGVPFSAAISLEQGDQSFPLDDYLPHVALGLGYDAGAVLLRASVAQDVRDGDEAGGTAFKLRADVPIGGEDAGASVFAMGLLGENASGYTTWSTGDADDETASVMLGHSMQVADRVATNSQVQWVQGNGDGDDVYNVVANLAWDLVNGFAITPELHWVRDAEGEDDFGGVLRAQANF